MFRAGGASMIVGGLRELFTDRLRDSQAAPIVCRWPYKGKAPMCENSGIPPTGETVRKLQGNTTHGSGWYLGRQGREPSFTLDLNNPHTVPCGYSGVFTHSL